MCDEPKITVGITTYNRPSFLRAAVASVISQSYQNFEIIISNDYLDKPVSIESLLDRKDPRVTVINQARNLGELDNMNFLLSIATGKYFTWLADDDLMLPNFFAKAMKSLQTNQNINCVGFYSSFSAAVNYMSHPLFNRAPPEITLLDQSLFIELYTARKISLIGCYGIFNTEKLREIEGITRLGRSFGPYSDSLIPIKLSLLGSLVYSSESLVFLRTHQESISSSSIDLAAYLEAQSCFMAEMVDLIGGISLRLNNQRIGENLARWFSDDCWAVIWRNQHLSFFSRLTYFFHSQIVQALKFLSPLRVLCHLNYIFFFSIKSILYLAYKRFHDKGSKWKF